MKIKALTSFSGSISMSAGQVIDCKRQDVIDDLVAAGYVEIVENSNTENEIKEEQTTDASINDEKKEDADESTRSEQEKGTDESTQEEQIQETEDVPKKKTTKTSKTAKK